MTVAHGFMTMIADEGRLDGVDVAPPRAAVGWVVTLRAFPCDLSLHLDRKDLERLGDRISQALQDHDSLIVGIGGPGNLSTCADDEGEDLDDKDTGPCEGCGRLADRVPVRDNGRVWFACPACAARVSGDVVDLDDPALTAGPEEGR